MMNIYIYIYKQSKNADDIDMIEEDRDMIEEDRDILDANAKTIYSEGRKAGLEINVEKTMSVVFGNEDLSDPIKVQDKVFENVKDFVYLGSILTFDNDCSKDIGTRIAKAKGVFAGFNNIWKSKQDITQN